MDLEQDLWWNSAASNTVFSAILTSLQHPIQLLVASPEGYGYPAGSGSHLFAFRFPSTKETDKLWEVQQKTTKVAGVQLEAQRDGLSNLERLRQDANAVSYYLKWR